MAFSSSKDTLFGVCTLLQQSNGAMGFLSATNAVVRRSAVRGGGYAVDNRSRVGGIRYVHAGAALAVRRQP